MVTMGVGVVGCADWSRLRQGAMGHGFRSWCQSGHRSVGFPGDAVCGALLFSESGAETYLRARGYLCLTKTLL